MCILKKRVLPLVFAVFSFAQAQSSLAIPTASEYIEIYNQNRGLFLRDHEKAQEAVKLKYRQVALHEFNGNILEFFPETFGAFNEYLSTRGKVKRYLTDYWVSSSELKCVEALFEFIQELSNQAKQAIEDGESPPSDPLVNSIIERTRIAPNSLRGLEALLKFAVKSQNKSCSGAMAFLTSIVGGCILPFYSRPCLMSLTEAAYPLIWTLTRGKAVPPVGSSEYLWVYLPAMKIAEGHAFMHSGPILSAFWVVGSGVSYGVWKLIIWSSNLTHRQFVRLYRSYEPQHHGNENLSEDQNVDGRGVIEMRAPLLPHEESSEAAEEAPENEQLLDFEQNLELFQVDPEVTDLLTTPLIHTSPDYREQTQTLPSNLEQRQEEERQ